MPIEIRMPALSPTMTEGNLARWLKKEGDEVHAGDVIAEIETDKATMEYEAVDEGRIGKIIVPEGAQGIKVNEPIAVLLEEGEDDAALAQVESAERRAAPAPGTGGRAEAGETGAAPLPSGPTERRRRHHPLPARGEREGPAPRKRRRVRGSGRRRAATAKTRIFASPLARRMARACRARSGADSRLRAAGPHRQGRHRAGAGATGRGAACRPVGRDCGSAARSRDDRGRRRDRAAGAIRPGVREGAGAGAGRQPALHRKAAYRDAPGHREAARRSRSRPSRISICRSIARSTNC